MPGAKAPSCVKRSTRPSRAALPEFARCVMQLKPFLLDIWLDSHEHDIEFNLAASEGPRWKLNEILSLIGEEERERFLNHTLGYSRPAGAEGLRAAIAEMQGVKAE